MSTAVPAAGEASAATAPAAATDPGPQSTALRTVTPPPAVPRCDNCGANVPGRFCGTCGQRLEPPVHTLWHFMQVAAEDVTHADSRLWRTLAALLFKPGFLTREFLAGHRARYLPPVRLYLVLSVVFFVWFAATSHTEDEVHFSPETRAAIAEARQRVRDGHSPRSGRSRRPWRHPGDSPASRPQERAERRCVLQARPLPGPGKTDPPVALRSRCRRSCWTTAARWRSRSCTTCRARCSCSCRYSRAVMMLLYWHPRHYYVEHLLFCLHNHAFAFLVLLLAGILSALLPFAAMLIGWVTTLYVAWYLYRSMRVMYGQGGCARSPSSGGLPSCTSWPAHSRSRPRPSMPS